MKQFRNNSYRRQYRAFTLIELMIVVAIIGVLASIAIPAFLKYIKKSRTAEARTNLSQIYNGQLVYFDEEKELSDGTILNKYFIQAASSPAGAPGPTKRTYNWDGDVSWAHLKFGADAPVLFQYSTVTSGVDTTAAFTARAQADMDGDGILSTFERGADYVAGTGIIGKPGFFIANELE